MAKAERVSAGVYRVNGKLIKAKTAEDALKQAGSSSGSQNSSKGSSKDNQKDKNQPKIETKPINKEEVSQEAGRQAEGSIKFGEDLANRLDDPNAFKKISTERRAEENEALEMLRNEYRNAQIRSPDTTLALDRFRAGLEGLNSEEGMALREAARRELDSQFQSQMAAQKIAAARSGVRGGAANAQQALLSQARGKAQGDLEQNLTLQNYGIKQQALQNFGNFVNQTEGREAQQRLQTSGLLANQLNTQTNRDLDRETFNINQDTNRALNRTQTILGGAGIQAGLFGNEMANRLGQENLRLNTLISQEQLRQGRMGLDAYREQLRQLYNRDRSNQSNNRGRK